MKQEVLRKFRQNLYLSLVNTLILTACDSNPAEVNKSSDLNDQVQSERKLTKVDSLNSVSNVIEPGGDGTSNISGCGTTTISFGTAGGTVEVDYTPYELLTFISANSTNFNATVQLNVSLDGSSIGSGIGGFQVDEDVGLGTHTITVNATTYCSGGPSTYITREIYHTIKSVPPPAPFLTTPVDNRRICSFLVTFNYNQLPEDERGLVFSLHHEFLNLDSRLQIDDDADFSSPVDSFGFDDNDGSGHVAILPHPDSDKKYYWRVQSRNEAGLSPWSEVRSFTICPAE